MLTTAHMALSYWEISQTVNENPSYWDLRVIGGAFSYTFCKAFPLRGKVSGGRSAGDASPAGGFRGVLPMRLSRLLFRLGPSWPEVSVQTED